MSCWHFAWQHLPSVYECVCYWANVTSAVKPFEQSVDWKSAIEMQVHSQYTLFNPNTSYSPHILCEQNVKISYGYLCYYRHLTKLLTLTLTH